MEELVKYIIFIVFLIGKIFKNNLMQIIIMISLFIFVATFENYLSVDAQNKRFEKDYLSHLKVNTISRFVMETRDYSFSGDDIKASEFFSELGIANIEMLKQYKENVNFYQIVINWKPSNPHQLNGDLENDIKIKNGILSSLKNKRFAHMLARKKLYLDKNPRTTCMSIYSENGINQKTFEENIEKYQGRLIGKKIDKATMAENENWRGQIIVIKNNKTKSYLVFREMSGEQAHTLGTTKYNKKLVYYGIIKNKYDISNKDPNLYNLMQEFNLFSLI